MAQSPTSSRSAAPHKKSGFSTESPARQLPPSPDVDELERRLERAGLRVLERDYPKGKTIFFQGDTADSLYFVASGRVRLYQPYNGLAEATTALLEQGAIFGEPDMRQGMRQLQFAEAASQARVRSVAKSKLEAAAYRDPELAATLVELMMQRVNISQTVTEGLLYRQVTSRLAWLLIDLLERFGYVDRHGDQHVGIPLIHRELAEMIASSREAVSHAIADFREDGLVTYRAGRISITDYEELARIAAGRAYKGTKSLEKAAQPSP